MCVCEFVHWGGGIKGWIRHCMTLYSVIIIIINYFSGVLVDCGTGEDIDSEDQYSGEPFTHIQCSHPCTHNYISRNFACRCN